MALTYSKQNGYLVPNLKMDETDGKAQTLGRFGRAREKYLMEHRKGLYSTMVLNGKLWKHLTEIDKAAQAQVDAGMSAAGCATEDEWLATEPVAAKAAIDARDAVRNGGCKT